MTDKESFEACEYWMKELDKHEEIGIHILVGNKVDLISERVV